MPVIYIFGAIIIGLVMFPEKSETKIKYQNSYKEIKYEQFK